MESNRNKSVPRDFKETFFNQEKSSGMSREYQGESYSGNSAFNPQKAKRLATPDVPLELEKNNKLSNYFDTSLGYPPFSTTNFSVTESGNSDPHIVRSTMYVIPQTNYLLEHIRIPLALVIHPLCAKAFVKESDAPPIQCMQCLSYLNFFSSGLQSTKGFRCNICNKENDVDVGQAAHPTVEYKVRAPAKTQRSEIVNDDYFFNIQINEPLLVFAIELSKISYSTGFYAEALNSIERMISDESLAFTKVCFLVFSDEVCVLRNKNGCAHEEHICDPEDLPLASPEIYFDTTGGGAEALLGRLRSYKPGATLYPVSKVIRLVSSVGGFYLGTKVALFSTSEKESAEIALYRERLVDNRVSLSIFNINENTALEDLASATNGRSYVYKTSTNDLYLDMFNLYTERSVYGANITVKTSDALGKHKIFGNGQVEGANSISFSHLDTKSAAAFSFFIDEALRDDQKVYFQVVVTYWRTDGRRRVLVCNLALSASSNIPLLYNNISFDTVFCAHVKDVVHDAENWKKNAKVMEDSLVSTLAYYRKQCCKNASPSHLHLPENVKLLPALCQSLLKNAIFNTKVSVRDHKNVLGMDVVKTFRYFYPRLFSFSDYFVQKKLESVRSLKLAHASLDPTEVCVLENGERIFVYLGKDVDEELRHALKSPEKSDEQDMLRCIVDELCLEYCSLLPVFFVEQSKGGYEVDFNGYLVEDRLHNHPSYEEFIYEMHYKVKK